MSRLVIDASVAIKWVIPESGTDEALSLLRSSALSAPDLLVAECANILWKKSRRNELSAEETMLAAQLIERADIEILSTRDLVGLATQLAIELDHPAYDCLYLAVAESRDLTFVTADERLIRKLMERMQQRFGKRVLSLADAARLRP